MSRHLSPLSILVASAVLLAGVLPATAQQPGTVLGHVVDAITRAPLAGAKAEAGDRVATTGADGNFLLTTTRGPVRIRITAKGHLPEQVDVVVGDSPVKVEVLLVNETQFKDEVVVTAPPEPAAAKPPSTIEVSPLEVRSIAGAAENVFRVLQTLPGVNATADFDSRIAVRGGGPDQNLTVMDGVEIHNPYRLFGLTSAFNPETVSDFQLTAGGFSPKYGDRLSSILLVENRAGTEKNPFAGSFSAALTDANVILEGKLPAGAKGSWLLTGRRTYYDLVASRFTDSDLPSFADLQGKATWETRPGQRFSVFALRSRERTDAQFDSDTNSDTLGLKNTSRNDLFSVSFASTIGTKATAKTTASWYRYTDILGADGNVQNESQRSNSPDDDVAFGRAEVRFTRDVAVRDLSLRQDVSIRAGNRHLVETGGELHLLRTSWGWEIEGDRNESEANGSSARGGAALPSLLDSRRSGQRAGAWIVDRFEVNSRLSIEPGVRLDWSSLSREVVVLPRLSAVVAVTPNLRLRAAGGLYSQSPGYEKLLQSDYFVDLTGTSRLRSERSVHALAAVERDWRGITARVEGYYKSFDRLVIGRLETPAEMAFRISRYDYPAALASSVPAAAQITSVPVNEGKGRAYGFDLYVSKRATSPDDRFTGWASYTWGRADRDAYGRRYAFEYDRRHAVSLVGTYRLSGTLELAGSARIASGFPYTPAVGLRVAAETVEQAGAPSRYVPATDANGSWVWTPDLGGVANINTGRLPLFARVDTRLTFRPRWGSSRWQFYAEVINVLNRKNAGALGTKLEYNPSGDRPRLIYERGAAIPLLPSIGVRLRF